MSIKYTRKAANVTTIEGVHFFPGTHIATPTSAQEQKVLKSDAWAFEVETGRIKADSGSFAEAASAGTVSLRELNSGKDALVAEIEAAKKALAAAKKAKTATAELKEIVKEKEVELADIESAVATRASELSDEKKDSNQ